jgi:ribosomal-protein-alanine N-acetyltransferase
MKLEHDRPATAFLREATAPLPPDAAGWRHGLPRMKSIGVSLREVEVSDAASLMAMLNCDEVSRYILPPPTTVDGFERFIAWAHAERRAGRYSCFGIIPDGYSSAVGVFQVRQLDPWFGAADWSCALGHFFWGTGIFQEAATLVADYAFERIGVHRLEARVAVQNRRANAAVRKLGATPEGILRKSFTRSGVCFDQVLWAIVEEDRVRRNAVWGNAVH